MVPQRFVVKEWKKGHKCVWFFKNHSSGWFVDIGGFNGYFILGNEKSWTSCSNLSWDFEGVEDNTLTGKPNYGNFTCTHVVAIQLE